MRDAIFQTAKILIVDDGPHNVSLIRHILQTEGYANLQSTNDGRDVARLYATFQPDLILLDLMMPAMDGFAVMEQLKPLIPEGTYLPILVITADNSQQTRNRALASGASDFLAIPFDPTEILLRAHNLLSMRFLHLQLREKNLLLEERVQECQQECQQAGQELLQARDMLEARVQERTVQVMAVIIALQTEVAEHQEAELSLQKANDQLQAILDTIPGGVSWISADGKYLGVNRFLADSFNLPPEAFVGQPVGFLGVSPNYHQFVRDFLSSAEEQDSFEFSVDMDGVRHTVFMTARKYDSDGSAVFIGTDISERKQAEEALQRANDKLEERVAQRTAELADVVKVLRDEIAAHQQAAMALRESEERFRAVTEAIPQQVWTAQPDGTLDYVNRRVLEHFWRTSGALPSR